MGNCQAVDNAALLIQHPNGRVDKLYSPISAGDVARKNPGHCVALLLTTTLYSNKNSEAPVRVTKIKLLRSSDTLVLGHVYRLVTTQEVMKGLWAKKQAKLKNQELSSDSGKVNVGKKMNQMKKDKQRSRNSNSVSKSRNWQPSLNSISEAAS